MAVDLHIHSTASDGGFSPRQVVEHAQAIGLKCIALTDHDAVSGIEEAQKRAAELELPFIPGIEMTALDRGEEVHLLGYFINPRCEQLLQTIKEVHQRIELRVKRILGKLRKLGIEVSLEEVKKVAGGGTLGRPHIARVMVSKGYTRTHQEAFDKYIGEGQAAYVEIDDAMSPEEAYRLISECGGVSSIAHPGYLGRAKMLEDDDIFNHRIWGAQAIEVFHPKHDNSMINFYINLAKKYDMAITGGSDCHGNFYPVILMDRKSVPDWVGEKFLAFCRKAKGKLPLSSSDLQR